MGILFLLLTQMPKETVVKKESLPLYEKSPTQAMLFSALFPGMGQFYTENYFKGLLYSLTEGLLLYFTLKEKEKEKRSNLIWWTSAFHIFNIADAYTSAHLYKFKENRRITLLISKKGVFLTLNFP